MKKILLVIALLVFGLWLVAACSQPATKEAVVPVTPAAPPKAAVPVVPAAPVAPVAPAIDAKALFGTNCAACHGINRQGTPGLAPALTPESLAALSDDAIRNTILKGKPNTAMSAFEGRLSVDEISALIQLIKRTSP